MKFSTALKALTFCSAMVGILAGCTALNPLPIAARAGDTVTIAVGSPDNMTKGNTTAVYYPDSGGSVPLTIKSILRLYPDPNSPSVANAGNSYWQITTTSGHQPWVSIAVIDLPTSGLPVGTGHVQFTTAASYPTVADSVNNIPIALEILPGTGSPHPLEYNIGYGATATGLLRNIEPSHNVTVHPVFDPNATWPTYGAVEITLKFAADGTPPSSFQLLSEDISPFTGSQRMVMQKVSGDTLTVSYVSPTGQLKYYEPRFEVVPLPARALSQAAPGTMPTAPPTVLSVRHFDINGTEVAGPGPANYTVEMN
jgi:hypothetical protein